jgi:hypothetical protein
MDKMSRQMGFLSAENTKMSARFTEMSSQMDKMSWQMGFLPAENTKMSGRSPERSQQMG